MPFLAPKLLCVPLPSWRDIRNTCVLISLVVVKPPDATVALYCLRKERRINLQTMEVIMPPYKQRPKEQKRQSVYAPLPDGKFTEIFNGPGVLAWEAVKSRTPTKNNLHMISIETLSRRNEMVPPAEKIQRRDNPSRD